MSTQVIPAINTDSFEEVKRRIKMVEPHVSWVQLDICDGTFTKNTTWHEASDLLSLETPLKIEVHLMINDIEKRIDEWLIAPVSRIIFHLEASKDPDFVMEKCKEAGKEVGMAIGPDTPWTRLAPYFGVNPVRSKKTSFSAETSFRTSNGVNFFQILGVYPGLAGQKFQEQCFDKIMHLRKECPTCIIEVDGGMDKETAKKATSAGANIINAATYIFNSKDIEKSIKELKNV